MENTEAHPRHAETASSFSQWLLECDSPIDHGVLVVDRKAMAHDMKCSEKGSIGLQHNQHKTTYLRIDLTPGRRLALALNWS
jgi:hypothetical protein